MSATPSKTVALVWLCATLVCTCSPAADAAPSYIDDPMFTAYVAKPSTVSMHWQNAQAQRYVTLDKLEQSLRATGRDVLFAMNGGMFHADFAPVGLYVDSGKQLAPINVADGVGNFFMKPNGIFTITRDGKAFVQESSTYRQSDNILFATQSGPMLIIDGKLHPKFQNDSNNKVVRNGVGVLPSGDVLMVISKAPVTFWQIAKYFEARGCRTALYLDGVVSRAIAKGDDASRIGGRLGVLIAVTQPLAVNGGAKR